MRALNERFMEDFLHGPLTPILDAVQADDTLALELRGMRVNIYYRGRSLYLIKQQGDGYLFETKYTADGELPKNPTAAEASELIYQYKAVMDRFLTRHPQMEREFQQLMARLNNEARMGKASDYYIADIEYAHTAGEGSRAQFDMVAFKWEHTWMGRKNTKALPLALIELKYGDSALDGPSGVEKHLNDLSVFLNNQAGLEDFCLDMATVFSQKCTLGLVPTVPEHKREIEISPQNPEVILAVVDHDPANGKLVTILEGLPDYAFEIRLASASFLGGALFEECILSIPEYLDIAKKYPGRD